MAECADPDCPGNADVPAGGVIEAYVWECGDEYCDCTEPRIHRYERHPTRQMRNVTTLWTGTFQIDGEGRRDPHEWKSEPKSTTELNRIAQHLRRHHHDLYRRIDWPWDRTRRGE